MKGLTKMACNIIDRVFSSTQCGSMLINFWGLYNIKFKRYVFVCLW